MSPNLKILCSSAVKPVFADTHCIKGSKFLYSISDLVIFILNKNSSLKNLKFENLEYFYYIEINFI